MSEADRPTGWITLLSGKQFFFDQIDPESIVIEDVAHYLSNVCRWGGHVEEFYSVAQHSVLASKLAPAKFALVALMHDASEAYIGDMSRPLKKSMPQFLELEERIMFACAVKFGFEWPMPPEVKEIDDHLLALEHRSIRGEQDLQHWNPPLNPAFDATAIQCWSPYKARKEFLTRFYRLRDRLDPQTGLFDYSEQLRRAMVGYDEAMSKGPSK